MGFSSKRWDLTETQDYLALRTAPGVRQLQAAIVTRSSSPCISHDGPLTSRS